MINLKFLQFKTLLRQKSLIWFKTFNKLVSLLKNKRKLKLILLKSLNTGHLKNSNLVIGVRDKTSFSEVLELLKSLKNFKKIKWSWVQQTLKDTLLLSRNKLNSLLEDFQIHLKFLIFGLKYKLFGEACSLSSLVVILLSRCLFKLKLLPVLIKLGWDVCKNHFKQKKFYNVVS